MILSSRQQMGHFQWVISKQHETVKHTAIMLRQKRRHSFPVMSSRTLKHNDSSACDSHPGGQGALGWSKCCGSWKSLSLWMLCLHSDKALKVLQFFTSHRPKAGPPDITTQPLPLTGARKRKMEICLHSFKHYPPTLWQHLFLNSKLARTGYLAGVCSS